MSHIGARFCNILNTFTGDSKKNIAILEVFGRRYIFENCMGNAFIKPHTIGRIYLAISNTGDAILRHLIALNARSTEYINGNFPQCFVFYAIRTKLGNQLA